jgi:CheY-like chemotaxis protein
MSSYSVLLVEDDPNDVLFVQRAFQLVNSAIELLTVEDGDAAVAYLSGSGSYRDRDRYPLPSLILLDLKLPRRSGVEVLRWLKAQNNFKRIPVVILTSSRERLDVDLAYDLGVNSYLVKPVSFDALAEMIAALHTYWLRLNEYPSVLLAE